MSYQVECPNNTYMCYKNLVDIMKNINTQQKAIDTDQCSDYFNLSELNKEGTIISCEKVQNSTNVAIKSCNNCDYLFENLIKGNTTCKELFDGLNSMDVNKLKTQIKYNLYQLVHMKAKVEPMRVFGTFSWWKHNIWGVNKMQNYIYIVSFTIALIMVSYFTYDLLSNISQKNGIRWVFFILIIAIIICVLIMVYTLRQVEYTPSKLDKRVVEKNKDKYGKKVKDNWYGETTGSSMIAWIIPFIIGCFVILLMIESTGLITRFVGQRLSNLIHDIIIFSIAGLIIALNMFYTFLIPQFILVGIILQKILMSSSTNIIVKILILISIAVITLVQYIRGSSEDMEKGICSPEQNPNIGWQYWFILTVLTIMTIINLIKPEIFDQFMSDRGYMGLFMEPYIYIFDGLHKIIGK